MAGADQGPSLWARRLGYGGLIPFLGMSAAIWLAPSGERALYPRYQMQAWLPMRLWLTLAASGSCLAAAVALLWGTLLPLGLAGINRALAPAVSESGASALRLWDYTMFGVVMAHWTLVLPLALGCFIVRVMKGPAYVADAYPLPDDKRESMTRL